MTSGTTTLDTAAVLASARRARVAANAAEAQVLADAVAWSHLHQVTDPDQASTVLVEHGHDTGIPIAGDGAPLVSEFAVADFATALGLSAGAGRNLVGQALELAHRLPKLWARVQAGSLAPWRARRVAEQTLCLSMEAAEYVDQMPAPFAHRTGPAQTQRLVQEAIARFMPTYAAQQRDRANEQRYFTIDHDQVSFAGTSRVHGELDLADALDLEDAVRAGAEQRKALGSEESLDVRRSLAVGILARGQEAFELGVVSTDRSQARCSTTGEMDVVSRLAGARTSTTGRDVVLYVHLSEDALRTGDADAAVWVENGGGQLVTASQVAQWCGRPDTSRVVVKPVIDLHQPLTSTGYQPSSLVAEHVRLRDRTCVFPWCQRPARSCDLDHVVPYDADGPPGQTSTSNLACLCRLHHRMKTHRGWTYTMLEPGVFLWRSPHGLTWLRDRAGTTDLTPPPVDPPHRRTC